MSETPAPAPAEAPAPMEVDGTVASDPHAAGVASLVEMGFDQEPSAAALKETGGNLEAAMEILVNSTSGGAATGEDGATAKVAKSIRCVETGKLFRNMNTAMIYAERSGKTNFEECDEEIPPMSAEEKAKKIEELKERIASKRAERAEAEKEEAKANEISRRAGGREMAAIREEVRNACARITGSQVSKHIHIQYIHTYIHTYGGACCLHKWQIAFCFQSGWRAGRQACRVHLGNSVYVGTPMLTERIVAQPTSNGQFIQAPTSMRGFVTIIIYIYKYMYMYYYKTTLQPSVHSRVE
jgi:hypothetical protein